MSKNIDTDTDVQVSSDDVSAFEAAMTSAVDEISGLSSMPDIEHMDDDHHSMSVSGSSRQITGSKISSSAGRQEKLPDWAKSSTFRPREILPSTDQNKFELGEIVQMVRAPGCCFRVTKVPSEDDRSKTYALFGGRSGRGGATSSNRYAYEIDLRKIQSKSGVAKAAKTMRAIDAASEKAPRPHSKKPGSK